MSQRSRTAAFGLIAYLLLVAGNGLAAPGGNGNGKGNGGDSGSEPTPYLSFAADRTEVASGERVQLSWASLNTKHCFASGSWDGKHAVEGAYTSPALTSNATYSLECKGNGTSVVATVEVAITSGTDTTTSPEPGEPAPPTEPTLSLEASAGSVQQGDSATLSWSATDADSCTASGGWSGTLATSGSQAVGPIDAATTYALSCTGAGGSVSDSVSVSVVAEPTVQLSAADSAVAPGSSTTLSWSSTDAGSCSASGGWSGSRATSGSEVVGGIEQSTTYSLSCTGAGGNAVAMISVAINDTVTLNWQAPSENTDGTALSDLTGYRIYYGLSTRSYTDSMQIDSAGTTSYAVRLDSGEYYFAMTALDADGNESAYSNEVIKVVP